MVYYIFIYKGQPNKQEKIKWHILCIIYNNYNVKSTQV